MSRSWSSICTPRSGWLVLLVLVPRAVGDVANRSRVLLVVLVILQIGVGVI